MPDNYRGYSGGESPREALKNASCASWFFVDVVTCRYKFQAERLIVSLTCCYTRYTELSPLQISKPSIIKSPNQKISKWTDPDHFFFFDALAFFVVVFFLAGDLTADFLAGANVFTAAISATAAAFFFVGAGA